MAKFRVNQKVQRKADGKNGVVRFREVKSVENYTKVQYLVDFGEGLENWQILERKDLMPVVNNQPSSEYFVKYYEVGDGRGVTLAARVVVTKDYVYDEEFFDFLRPPMIMRTLIIGYSIYNGEDIFDPKLGRRMAIHRCKKNPFTSMNSIQRGEFNKGVVEMIMDAKADYIIKHIDRFSKR